MNGLASPRRKISQTHRKATAVRASSEARLSLAEVFLASDDVLDCAGEALTWLEAHAGALRALCTLIDHESEQASVIASLGFEGGEGPIGLSVASANGSITAALSSLSPVRFAHGGDGPPLFERDAYWALPLRSRDGDAAVGVLFVVLASDSPGPDLTWVAALLGEKLTKLRNRRTLAEQRYLRERTLLYSILNAVADPILLTDIEGRLIIANTRAERLFASREEESEGRRRAVAMNNMLFSASISSLAFEQGASGRSELLLVDPTEGSDLLFELMASVVEDPGEGTSVVAILRNVTDLGRAAIEIELAEQKLRAAEADMVVQRHRLELIIDSVADPIVVIDPAGDILLMNDPAEKILSVPEPARPEELRRVRTNEAHFSSFVSNLLVGGHDEQRYRGEIHLLDPRSGEALPVEALAGKILSEQGALNAVVTILHDRREAIERGQLYEQLKEASQELERKIQEATAELANQNELLRRQALELERASAAKSQFLANMSHELRTPLNAMLGYTAMLLQGVSGELTPPQKQKLSRVEANGKNLLAIINEILDITRIEAGRMPLNVSTFDLGAVVQEVVAELEGMIARSRLEVNVQIEPRLPQVRSDRQKVKQIVLNLLGNAIKFTREGSVTLATRSGSNRFELSVCDTGIGIAPEHLERIFEDFQQVDSSPTRQYGGTGLGLAICRRLARMLDGEISLESTLGKGSTFTLTLPRRVKRR